MFCRYCGNEIANGAKFCTKCGKAVVNGAGTGANIQQPAQPIQPQYEPVLNTGGDTGRSEGKKPGLKILAVAIALLCLIAACVFGYLVYFDSGRSSDSSEKIAVNNDNKHSDAKETESGDTKANENDEKNESDYEILAGQLKDHDDVNISLVSYDVSDYPTVRLYISVEDDYGETVTLSDPRAAILETISDEKELEQKVDSIVRLEGNQGISIDLVADESGSMDSDLVHMQDIMKEFVSSLDYDSGDCAEIISFDSYVMYMCTYTDDVDLLKNGIDSMSAYGETALYDALYEGILNAGNRDGAKCVIGFTDGEDNYSTHTAYDVISLAQYYSVPVYIVTTYGGNSQMLSIADETGGRCWDIDSIYDVSEVLDEIYSMQKDMYCLSYESSAASDAYVTREISYILGDDVYMAEQKDEFTPVETIETKAHSSRYELVVGEVSWNEANEAARETGGHLITITSENEMSIAEDLANDAGLKYIWLGGYTSVKYDNAYGHWVTGEDFSQYTNWYEGEPSRNDSDGTPEMYLMMWQVDGEWSWNDERNDPMSEFEFFTGKSGYIIEYED